LCIDPLPDGRENAADPMPTLHRRRKGESMYELYIANKNYSSWSLRPWVLMQEAGIEFREHLIPFGGMGVGEAFRKLSPSGKVPCLVDGKTVVWDSLAIVEYLAERHRGVWPQEARRAPGRAAPRPRCIRASRSCATAAP
jgi:hypothetical protein